MNTEYTERNKITEIIIKNKLISKYCFKHSKNIRGIKDASNIFNIFLLKRTRDRQCLIWNKDNKLKIIIENIVAKAAPFIPIELFIPKIVGRGINKKFSIKFIIDDIIMLIKITFDFPIIEISWWETMNIEEKNIPKESILKEVVAIK